MSTLRTRIGGYLFLITTEEDGRRTGAFCAESTNGERTTFMDLPFELRSTYSQKDGQTIGILASAIDAVDTLDARTTYAAETHEGGCSCEACRISLRIMDRQFAKGRGCAWMTKAYARYGRPLF
jgi:hypothetical protein